MDTPEFIVTALSVGKVAALQVPNNPVVDKVYDRLRGVVAIKIGEDAALLLYEALAGSPDVDIDWLKRFVETTGMADEPRLYAAALDTTGVIIGWAASTRLAEIRPHLGERLTLDLDGDGGSVTVGGGEQTLTFDVNGRLISPEVGLFPGSLGDLAYILGVLLAHSLLPGEPGAPSSTL